MDVFALRKRIIDDYEAYTRSFLTILDPTISAFVRNELSGGKLWPDALIQLSPAYAPAQTVADLAATGVLHPLCASIFRDRLGHSLTLYRHQRDAIDLAAQRQPYVVTTGTSSGKSLTYIIPIVDHVLHNTPENGRVRAIVVYPMNALINSQKTGIDRFFANLPESDRIVRCERYTGQEREADKKRIQQDPPHIRLTNYVMLELMLPLGPLPQAIKERLAPLLPRQPKGADADMLRISFEEPAPRGVELIGRNHPLTTALADYLLETALTPENGTPLAARCGLVRTAAVAKRTVLLLRVRMLIEQSSPQRRRDTEGRDIAEPLRPSAAAAKSPVLAEELVVVGYTRGGGAVQWLDEPAALELLATAQPSANVTRDERTLGVQSALDQLGGLGGALNDIAEQRAARLRESHQRVRGATTGGRVAVTPRTPPDVLGVYVLLPAIQA